MATYLIHWEANPENWPSNPNEIQAVWEQACAGGDMQLASGGLKEIRWLSDIAGYAVAECDSKADAMALVTPFFPWFNQTIQEAVPWEEGRDAVLGAARQMAGG